jgi:hypothetical protein
MKAELFTSVVAPDSLNPDPEPASQVNPDMDPDLVPLNGPH